MTLRSGERRLGDCDTLRDEWPVLGLIARPAWRFYLWESASPPDGVSAGNGAGELLTEAEPRSQGAKGLLEEWTYDNSTQGGENNQIIQRLAPREAQLAQLSCP